MNLKKEMRRNKESGQGLIGLRLDEGGIVLILSLFMTVVLSLVGIAFVGLAFNENEATLWQRDGVQALYLADLATERARSELNQRLDANPNKTDFDAELTANGGYLFGSNTGYADFAVGPYQPGRYRVLLTNNNDAGGATNDVDRTVWATAEGIVTVRGHTRIKRVQVLLGSAGGGARAIITEGNLTIPGNPTIAGTLGSVHTNTNLAISGNPAISQDATASGTYSESGDPTIGGTAGGGVAPIPLPIINPAAYLSRAEYILQADGKVVRASDGTTMLDTAATGNSWPANNGGWKRSSGPPQVKWEWGGNNIMHTGAESIFYVEGDAQVSANPGSAGDPWDATIIAAGHIDISGNPTIQAKDGDGLLFVAGTDVKISGNPGVSYVGIILANEQLSISGQPTFTGFAIARDYTNSDPFIVNNEISGNPTITYDGNPPGAAILRLPIDVMAWREVGL